MAAVPAAPAAARRNAAPAGPVRRRKRTPRPASALTVRKLAPPRCGDAGGQGGEGAAEAARVDDLRQASDGQFGQWLARPARPLGVVVGALPAGVAAEQRRCVATVFVDKRFAIFCVDTLAVSADACEPGAHHDVADAVGGLCGFAEFASLPMGLFGLGPAAAAALLAAAAQRARLQAVVACGGRLDPAFEVLPLISLATLLVVGGAHEAGLASHRVALQLLPGTARLETIPGAQACLSEPGCFETALHHTARWFGAHLGRRA